MGSIRSGAGAVLVVGLVIAATVAQAASVTAAKRRPIGFLEPTSIELEPAGTLLLVENNPGSLLRVDPLSGRVTVIVRSVARPYAVVRTHSGRVFFSAATALRRVDAGRAPATVARADSDIGPVAAARDGTLYYATGAHVYRVIPGSGSPELIGGRESLAAPHGLVLAADGALLVSDTGHDRIVRIDPASGAVASLAHVRSPRGIDVAPDGTIYVVDSGVDRVLHLSASGTRIGYLARTSGDVYDVQVARGGVVYVLEAGVTGWVRRIARDGTVTTVSRP